MGRDFSKMIVKFSTLLVREFNGHLGIGYALPLSLHTFFLGITSMIEYGWLGACGGVYAALFVAFTTDGYLNGSTRCFLLFEMVWVLFSHELAFEWVQLGGN